MLKCYVRGDPPAVFPKKRSVLLAAVVLLVCCCLVVPAVVAEDVTVEPTVFGDNYCELSPDDTEENTYYVWLVEAFQGNTPRYHFGVNVTSPLVDEMGVSVEWTKYTYSSGWGWSSTRVSPRDITTVTYEDTKTSTVTTTPPNSPLMFNKAEDPYYTAKITVDGTPISDLTYKFYIVRCYLIKPMDLIIYANASTFPKPRYEYYSEFAGSSSTAGFLVNDVYYMGNEIPGYPFDIVYEDEEGTQVEAPDQSGIYTMVIESNPNLNIEKSDIHYKEKKESSNAWSILFQDGLVNVLPTTENVMLSRATSLAEISDDNEMIFADFPDSVTDYYHLNGWDDVKYQEYNAPWEDPALFLQDDLLDEEAALITEYIHANRPGYDAEMKYFDMVVDNIWVDLIFYYGVDYQIYWPYPEGTDRNTEFTLLYFPDTRRSIDITGTIVTTLGEPISLDITKDDHYLYYEYWNYAGLYALIWKDATDPVVIEPVNQTIYANEHFPSPLYSGIQENAVIKVNDAEWKNDDYPYPFDIAYYNTTTNTQIFKPDTPGIYNATIQPVSGVQLAQITIDGNPVTFRNGTLTIRQITDANETIPVAQQTLQNDGISVSVPADTTYYLNDNTSLPVTSGNIHLLHDAILAGGEETLKRIAPEYFDDSSKYEMKYFDLIDTGNGHTWVSSSKDVTITWPYPEGTDENTEFTLLHYLDLHREYFTDADLNSKTEPVTVSKTGSGVQFSIPRSGFSPFALIWSDAVTHTVTFETYDGSQTQKVVKDGEPLSRPADPVREGYTFTGWYTDQDCNNPWDFNTPVTEDMTLYAGWKQNNPPSGGGSSDGNMDNAFRVLFNDGTTTLFVVTDLSYGDKLTKPEDPVKDGYTFAGWHKDAACTQAWDFADGITGDMTLYAKWTPVQTVTPTVTPTATVSVTPTGTAEPSGLPTTTPTVQPTGEDDGGKPAGSVLPLIGGILILILAILLLLFLLLRHTVTFLIPTGGEITEHRIKVWHGRYIDPADLPELLRTAAWYRDPARRERWDFDEDRVTKSMELYLG